MLSIENLKLKFEDEVYKKSWNDVFFRMYTRLVRDNDIIKINIKKLKHYLSFYFFKGKMYYSYLSKPDEPYMELNIKIMRHSDTRKTTLAPKPTLNLRFKSYFNNKIEAQYRIRVG